VKPVTRNKTYYPLFLDVEGKLCVVIGGGQVAERKVRTLLAFGARVRVVSPKLTQGLGRLKGSGTIEHVARHYREEDSEASLLVIAATSSRAVNRQVREDAGRAGVLVNVVDDPALCDFLAPSIVKKDPLVIAISTSGVSPGAAKRLRKELETAARLEYAPYVTLVGRFRIWLAHEVPNRRVRRRILRDLGRMEIGEVLQSGWDGLMRRFSPGGGGPEA
jgi:siroheme synthase-like protein